eukprot:m.52169 g.52169  ORF g.52169 m.52169 type:complete len:397 (+) comp9086_c0_seq2:79-1269(+)
MVCNTALVIVVLLGNVATSATAVLPNAGNCTNLRIDIDLSGHDCGACGGTKTLNSTAACCAACQEHAAHGCKFWTYATDLRHCYLKTSDAGSRKSGHHVSGSLPGPTSKACPVVAEPPAPPHPPLPAGQYRFPYNNPHIVHDVGDGCPGLNLDTFDNGAEECAAVWRDECWATHGSDEDPGYCECGTPRAGGSPQHNCYQCIGQPSHLERKPANVTAYKNDDMCGRYPPITRRQIIERALGWVTNGFNYGIFNRSEGGNTPETCGSEDEAECPQYSYESVCNGLLEMSWKSDDTNIGPGKSKSWPPVKIDCLDVRPGDWLHIGAHMQMFRRWLNGSGLGKEFVLYQMGGGWGKANAVVKTFTSAYNPCYRRPNIINDDVEGDGHYCSTKRPVNDLP